MANGVPITLNDRQYVLLQAAVEVGHADVRLHRRLFPGRLSGETRGRDFRLLAQADLLEKHGNRKGTYYTLTPRGQELAAKVAQLVALASSGREIQ